ncbi:MAG: MMPL family transporter [Sandaracinaceae bacterium]|nr:MMPL family transporter [Sandaracinaceae bacterium]
MPFTRALHEAVHRGSSDVRPPLEAGATRPRRIFAALGRLSIRRPWTVLAVSALVLVASSAVIARGGALSTGETRGTESDAARRAIDRELHMPGTSSFAIVFSSDTLTTDDPAFGSAMTHALAPLRRDPHVARVIAPDEAPPITGGHLISEDYRHALAIVTLREEYREAIRIYPSLRARVQPGVLEASFTGHLAFRSDLDRTLEEDLILAEVISIPLALIVLLLVFRTFVSALLPVGVGGLAVASGVAGIMALSRVADVPMYAINVVSLIGTGMAIDYSLFIVSRYRDELASGKSYDDALVDAVSTAGRAVTFSGLAVGVGLSGLVFFRGSFLAGLGLAGAIVVLLSVIFALTFLPALLKVLGSRVDAGRVPFTRRAEPAGRGWRVLVGWVMKRPLLVLLPTLVLVLTLGAPFRHLRMAQADITALPRTSEARRGWELMQRAFPDEAANRILVVVRFPSSPALNRQRALALYDLSQRIRRMPAVRDVQSVVDLGEMFNREATAIIAETPREDLMDDDLGFARDATVGRSLVVLTVLADVEPSSDEARSLVRRIRSVGPVGDGTVTVTGQSASDVDVEELVLARAPYAVGFVVVLTYLTLLLLLRSVILPAKAVLMNFLSIAASFGALVWIFQDGHLSDVLRFERGPIDPALPVLLFCAVFGLSMDYEVLMLTRMQEEYAKDGDNARAVAEGLARSGRLITSAAAIMVAVFIAFSIGEVLMVKAMGVGMALAIALDATLVRILIVPSTMRLFGDFNWWAPSWLTRILPKVR